MQDAARCELAQGRSEPRGWFAGCGGAVDTRTASARGRIQPSMTVNNVEALMRWCERDREPLRDAGVSLKVLPFREEHAGIVTVNLESAHRLLQVTVDNHMGMFDAAEFSLPALELRSEHHEDLDAG
jgi:hypothetical protein